MESYGSAEEGFALGVSDVVLALHVRVWGFWSFDTSALFTNTVLDKYRTGYAITIDATELKPLREVGEAAFGRLMNALPRLGVKRVSVKTFSPLTKLQLVRIARESAVQHLVQFIQESAQ